MVTTLQDMCGFRQGSPPVDRVDQRSTSKAGKLKEHHLYYEHDHEVEVSADEDYSEVRVKVSYFQEYKFPGFSEVRQRIQTHERVQKRGE